MVKISILVLLLCNAVTAADDEVIDRAVIRDMLDELKIAPEVEN